jgi:hypothetical protein
MGGNVDNCGWELDTPLQLHTVFQYKTTKPECKKFCESMVQDPSTCQQNCLSSLGNKRTNSKNDANACLSVCYFLATQDLNNNNTTCKFGNDVLVDTSSKSLMAYNNAGRQLPPPHPT